MIELLLFIWLFCGIFAILYLCVETWRYTNEMLNDHITLLVHILIMIEVMKVRHLFMFIAIIALGPIGIAFTRLVVRDTKEDFKKMLNDDKD